MKIKLKSIKLDRIKTSPKKYNSEQMDLSTKMNFIAGVKSIDENVIYAGASVGIVQGDNSLINMELSCMVEIDKKTWETLIGEDKITLPSELLFQISALLYDSARGAILMKNMNNNLSFITLPLFQKEKMKQEDFIIPIDITGRSVKNI